MGHAQGKVNETLFYRRFLHQKNARGVLKTGWKWRKSVIILILHSIT